MLAHAWLFGTLAAGLPAGAGGRHVPPRAPALTVRQVTLQPHARELPAAVPPTVEARAAAHAQPVASTRAAQPSSRPRQTPVAGGLPAMAPDAPAATDASRAAGAAPDPERLTQGPAAVAALAAAAPAPEGSEPPVYVTRLPPALTLHYSWRRGGAVADVQLRWQPGEGRYELTLAGNDARGPQWRSRGLLGAHGVAPERFAVARRGRERHAANFQREAGRITFSGPTTEHPLWRGAQDRLSWLLQLAAVLEAEPWRAEPGQTISMWVVGAHGDADVWAFAVVARETLADAGGRSALHLVREANRPYDPRVELWLDPARHHLPLRLRLSTRAGGESTEWVLRALHEP